MVSTVTVPPDIVDTESSTDVTVSEGDNVTLSCRATGRPEPRILWKREDSSAITVFSPKSGFITGKLLPLNVI